MVNLRRGKRIHPSLVAIMCSLSLCLTLWACYPGGPNSSVELTTITTGYDKSYNFNKPNYALLDSIVHIIDEDNPDNNVELSREYDTTIIAAVRRNMQSLGYNEIPLDEIDDSGDVDIIMLLGAIGTKNIGYAWSPWYPWYGWWGGWGYWPGYGPGWGWGYPWYPGGGGTVYQYDTGTLLINMLDPENANPDSLLQNLSWSASINGLLNSVNEQKGDTFFNESIDQAYRQSDYLGVK